MARAAAVLGMAGSAVSAASFLTMLGAAPGLAQTYVAGDSAARAVIVALGLPQLDPLNILVQGGPGAWYLVVNLLALRGGRLPRLQAIIGLGLALGMGLAVAAAVLRSELLGQIAAGAGAVRAPTWCTWLGARLLRPPEGRA